MKYILFDQNAISTYVSESHLQSIEYPEGLRFVQHICGSQESEVFFNTIIEHTKEGVLFIGQRKGRNQPIDTDNHIFCIDLTTCALLSEKTEPAKLLTIIQKAFRLTLKIWNRYPFSSSERVNGTKSILFPFSVTDRHRLAIERSNKVSRLEKRGISYPLLAYKYNSEDPGQTADKIRTDILRLAGEEYIDKKYGLLRQLDEKNSQNKESHSNNIYKHIEANKQVERGDFIYWDYDYQFASLTESQRQVVEYEATDLPLRVDGAAGTGKTISLIMRAYRLLSLHEKQNKPFHIIFFAHSESTSLRNKGVFSLYKDSEHYLHAGSEQSICFTTLFSFCCRFSRIDKSAIIETDASDSKSYQLMLIDDVVKRAFKTNRIRTFQPLLSSEVYSLFEPEKTNPATLANMLQHEFSVQIKGRTDGIIENYLELESIPNGIPCKTKQDKELVFSLFTDYQKALQEQGTFDVDDVTIETISRLNAPIWRRTRQNDGFDYIIVDEMHLFNRNEQSIFHFISKDVSSKNIPLCFALDYCQAIGDRGDTTHDYASSGVFGKVKEQNLYTLFRNSPQIVDFCAAIATSGTLMFGATFSNPYTTNTQYHFTNTEESKMQIPILHMYADDDTMLSDLGNRLNELMMSLQCSQKDIAIIAFDDKWLSEDGISSIKQSTQREFTVLNQGAHCPKNQYILTSPYAINGLEFQAVIMLGVDEGRLPQTTGTGDISRHFIMYSAYNMLYLSASRAKYRVIIMGSKLRGVSSCLEHSIKAEVLNVEDHSEIVPS